MSNSEITKAIIVLSQEPEWPLNGARIRLYGRPLRNLTDRKLFFDEIVETFYALSNSILYRSRHRTTFDQEYCIVHAPMSKFVQMLRCF